MFELIRGEIRDSKKVVFVTGSGISQESGIPTFRGKDGLWKNYDVMQLATIDAFYDHPKLVWKWYNERRKNIFSAEPNLGHRAIAELEKFVKVVVLTQNIDGLHQRAGSTEVLELHGSIVEIKCTNCDFKSEILTEFTQIPPLCQCGNILRPNVVWFGESLPQNIWQQAIIHASTCDMMIVVGTSLVVSPVNTLPIHAKQNNATVIEINPEETMMSSYMDLSIRCTGALTLPKFVSIFKKVKNSI